MPRLVDYRNEQLNAMFDALPIDKRIAIIGLRFDEFVKTDGVPRCSGCKRIVAEIGGFCENCDVPEPTPEPAKETPCVGFEPPRNVHPGMTLCGRAQAGKGE